MTSDANGVYRGVYTYGEERISVRDLVEVEGVPNDPLYYMYDGRGSVTQLTNAVGNVRDKYRYTPFGEEMSGGKLSPNTKLLNNPYGYNGEYHDLESGFQYLRARYYNPETARFITRDSYLGEINKPLSLNRYAYTANNPVKYKDPSGNDFEDGATGTRVRSVNISTKSVSNRPVVGWGSKGDAVVMVQNILDELGYDLGPSGVDGVYGKHTNKAIKSYQTAHGLQSDGIVGPETWGSFNGYINKKAAESEDRSKNNNACDDLGGGVVSGNGAQGTGNDNDLPLGIGFVKSSPTNTKIEIKNLPEEITRTQIKQKASEIQPKGPGGNLFILAFLTTWNIVNEENQLDADPWEIAIDESQEALKKYKSDPNTNVTTDEKGRTIIYRLGKGTDKAIINTLTPRPGKDGKIGMSWSFIRPDSNYVQSTIEEINETGVLVAIPDGTNHVSVRPIVDDQNFSKLKNWTATKKYVSRDSMYSSRNLPYNENFDETYQGHEYTQLLKKYVR